MAGKVREATAGQHGRGSLKGQEVEPRLRYRRQTRRVIGVSRRDVQGGRRPWEDSEGSPFGLALKPPAG